MTKRKKVLPARKLRDRSRDDESLLLRSAESLGRVIGSLQRQLDGVTKRLAESATDAWEALPSLSVDEEKRRGMTTRRAVSKARDGAKKKSAGAKKKSAGGSKKTSKPAARPKTRR